MANKIYQDLQVKTLDGTATYDAECYSDHEGHAVFAAYGHESRDKDLLNQYRADTGQQLKGYFSEDVGRDVKEVSLFIDNGGERLSGTKFEYDSGGEIERATPDPRDHISPQTFSDIGAHLDARDWANQQELSQHSFNPENRPDISDITR